MESWYTNVGVQRRCNERRGVVGEHGGVVELSITGDATQDSSPVLQLHVNRYTHFNLSNIHFIVQPDDMSDVGDESDISFRFRRVRVHAGQSALFVYGFVHIYEPFADEPVCCHVEFR